MRISSPVSRPATCDTVLREPLPWFARVVLRRPLQIQANLDRIAAAGIVERVPNVWQIFVGVLRMWYRIFFDNAGIGTCQTDSVRTTRRARLFEHRAIRLPFLLWEGSVVPLDLSGLASPPERLMTHLLGTHHDGDAFFYDLRVLACHPGMLEELHRRTLEVVRHDTRRARWLRDLCVYEGYHEHLLAAVERARRGEWRVQAVSPSTDTSLEAYLDWCAAQPSTPAATRAAWRRGELDLGAPSVERTA